MQLKRQHSAEPLNSNGTAEARKNSKSNTPSAASTPKMSNDLSVTPPLLPGITTAPIDTKVSATSDESLFVGSPMKKHRASMAGSDDGAVTRRLGAGMAMPGAIGEILGSIGHTQSSGPEQFGGAIVRKEQDDEDEEL